MILNICDSPDILKVMRIVDIVITIIKIITPIILIVSGMINYLTAVKDNDSDALNKANKMLVKKIIASILIFLIPTFVNLIAKMTEGSLEYSSCITNATPEGINIAYYNNSKKYIDKAYKSKSSADYNNALSYIDNIDDESKKQELINDLFDLKLYLNIKDKIDKKEDYTTIEKEINSINNNDLKEKLLKLLEENYSGKPLNISSSFQKYNDSTYPIFSGYYLYIPKNATEKMPLVVVFPPNSLSGSNMKSIVETKSLENLKAFIYIPLLASSERKDWNTSASNNAVKQINDLVNKYKIDTNRISLTAFSSSGWYIYQTANDHRIFSAIAPISSGMSINTIKQNYNDWEYLKTLPMKGYGEKGGPTTQGGRSCANKTVNWSAKTAMCSVFEGLGKCSDCLNCDAFTYLPEVCHGEIGQYVFNIDNNNNNISDILEWMISQSK